MDGNGKLEKMLILAYADSKKAESGGVSDADGSFQVLVNPESYIHNYKIKFSDGGQGQGTSGTQLKYENSEPEEMTFEFLFDNTGIIDGQPKENIADDLKKFRDLLVGFKGDSHEPRHFKVIWGKNSIFKGRVTELTINHKLFRPDGTPIRANATVKFRSSIEDNKRAAKEDKKSSDLTHIRTVKQSDTLPLLCYSIYGDSKYYIQVAKINGLSNFRKLEPGTKISFPPMEKNV